MLLHHEKDLCALANPFLQKYNIEPWGDHDRGGKIFECASGHTIHHVWLFRQDAPLEALRLNPLEVADACCAAPEEIRHMVRKAEFLVNDYLEDFLRMLPVL